MKCLILSDLHGQLDKYLTPELYLSANDSNPIPIIQLGDFGFSDNYQSVKHLTRDRLMIIGGNHDEYPELIKLDSYLGDFGLIPNTNSTFFIRGAQSTDKAELFKDINWWKEEELTLSQGNDALDLYETTKPKIMLSHDCPDSIKYKFFKDCSLVKRSFTGRLLDECLKIHKPLVWIFGHLHMSKKIIIRHNSTTKNTQVTKFICLNIGQTLTIDLI